MKVFLISLLLSAIFLVGHVAASESANFHRKAMLLGDIPREEKIEKIEEYFSGLSDESFLTLLREIDLEDKKALAPKSIFTTHLSGRWDGKPLPVSLLTSEVLNKSRAARFRELMVDFLGSQSVNRGRASIDNTGVDFTAQARQLINDLKPLVVDKSEPPKLRSDVMRGVISEMLGYLFVTKALDDNMQSSLSKLLIAILSDKSEAGAVRGNAISPLIAFKDKNALPLFRELARDIDSDKPYLIQGAVAALAELKDPAGIPIIVELMINTRDDAVFRAANLSLARYNNPHSLRIILRLLEIRERQLLNLSAYFGITRDVLREQKREYILDALELVKRAGWTNLNVFIFPLLTDENVIIRKAALEVLYLGGKKNKHTNVRYFKTIVELTKGERDTGVLELLKKVRQEYESRARNQETSSAPTSLENYGRKPLKK